MGMGTFLLFAFAIMTFGLGMKGFTANGLPFTEETRIKGAAGVVVGIVCILIGFLFLACALGSALGW